MWASNLHCTHKLYFVYFCSTVKNISKQNHTRIMHSIAIFNVPNHSWSFQIQLWCLLFTLSYKNNITWKIIIQRLFSCSENKAYENLFIAFLYANSSHFNLIFSSSLHCQINYHHKLPKHPRNEPDNVQASAKSGYDCYYINRNDSNEDNIKYWAADEAER